MILQSHRTALERCDFDIYGLATEWQGRRCINGSSSSDHRTTSFKLGHTETYDDNPPRVTISTLSDEPACDLHEESEDLVQRLWREGGWDLEPLQQTISQAGPTHHWQPIPVSVDGVTVTFRSLRQDKRWVALGQLGQEIVSLDVDGFEPGQVALEVVRDFEPYLQWHPA